MPYPEVTLRYFPVVGRAQPLRAALCDAGVPFHDLQVDLRDWSDQRSDVYFAGPYRGLPTLTWDGHTLAETLPIATFLSKQLGEYGGLSDLEIARREAITSNCYIEICLRVGELIWTSAAYPGVDPRAALALFAPRMLQKLEAVDAQLRTDWLCGARPGLCDFFAVEALAALRHVLGSSRDPALRALLPRLFALAERCAQRPQLEPLRRNRPVAFTSRPDEADALVQLASADLGAYGL